MDAAHFVFMAYLGYIYCKKRKYIKAPSGRKRFNVLGAVDAVTKKVWYVCNQAYINAESVCLLLEEISKTIKLKITIVLDNARYQKCELVQKKAESLGIELLYLPPYSPNLNLIERMWKFVKKKCLYSKYYKNFETFSNTIQDCLLSTTTEHKKELKTLLSLKFQLFNKTQVITS